MNHRNHLQAIAVLTLLGLAQAAPGDSLVSGDNEAVISDGFVYTRGTWDVDRHRLQENVQVLSLLYPPQYGMIRMYIPGLHESRSRDAYTPPRSWDVSKEHFLEISSEPDKQLRWIFELHRISLVAWPTLLQDLREYGRTSLGASARHHVDLVKPEPLCLVTLLDTQLHTNQRSYFDFCALDDGLIVLYVLLENRMTTWHYTGWRHSGSDSRTDTDGGVSLYGFGEWPRVATFDCEFKGHFKAYQRGDKVYFVTHEGSLFLSEGFDAECDLEFENTWIAKAERTARGGMGISMDADLPSRFLGVNEERITTTLVVEAPDLEYVVDDKDSGEFFLVTKDFIIDRSGRKLPRGRSADTQSVPGVDGPMADVISFLPEIQKARDAVEKTCGRVIDESIVPTTLPGEAYEVRCSSGVP